MLHNQALTHNVLISLINVCLCNRQISLQTIFDRFHFFLLPSYIVFFKDGQGQINQRTYYT